MWIKNKIIKWALKELKKEITDENGNRITYAGLERKFGIEDILLGYDKEPRSFNLLKGDIAIILKS